MNSKILETIIKKEILINIGINRNKSCIWITIMREHISLIPRLIETRVVFECDLIIALRSLSVWLIETRVVFEYKSQTVIRFIVFRLIETRVVFE